MHKEGRTSKRLSRLDKKNIPCPLHVSWREFLMLVFFVGAGFERSGVCSGCVEEAREILRPSLQTLELHDPKCAAAMYDHLGMKP